MDSSVFVTGATVVRRDVLNGQVWSVAPYRVVGDQGARLVLACWPGIVSLAPTTWIEWLRSGDDVVRKQGIDNLASGRWELDRWVWRETAVLSWFGFDADFSVHRFFPITSQSCRPRPWPPSPTPPPQLRDLARTYLIDEGGPGAPATARKCAQDHQHGAPP